MVQAAPAGRHPRARGHELHRGLPYEGEIAPNAWRTWRACSRALACSAWMWPTPSAWARRAKVRAIEATLQHFGVDEVSGHFTTPTARRCPNTLAALEMGVWNFQSSVAGLGGCPYAKVPPATWRRRTWYMLHGMGIDTGIDLDRLIDAGAYISGFLDRKPNSRVANALLTKRAG